MARPVPVSYSRLTQMETCPRKFHAINIAKSVKEEPNEITEYGTQVHLAFADYFKKGKPLPLHMVQYQKYLEAIKKAPGSFLVEQKLAVTGDFAGTGWFDEDVYLRVISDLTIMNGPKCVTWDWKTGRMYDDFTQLKLTGVVMFMLAPELEEITLAYLWTKSKQITKDKMVRADIPAAWAIFAPRLQRYQEAFDRQEFPPKPNKYCRGCPVTSCQYWEKRK